MYVQIFNGRISTTTRPGDIDIRGAMHSTHAIVIFVVFFHISFFNIYSSNLLETKPN